MSTNANTIQLDAALTGETRGYCHSYVTGQNFSLRITKGQARYDEIFLWLYMRWILQIVTASLSRCFYQ